MTKLAHLSNRGVIDVGGDDRVAFLQGLVSNDVANAGVGVAVWAALLTPQGKWLADFFIIADGHRLLLDCERAQVGMLIQRLERYRLRAKVALADLSAGFGVYVAWDGPASSAGDAIIAADPRLPEAGTRILSHQPVATNASADEWDRHRIALGLPDGSRDLEPDKSVLLEAGFDELGGVSWTKGCYMGQELTARTKYRGLIKRRLAPVEIEGAPPAPGTPVLRYGAEVGVMRSSVQDIGLATLRLDAFAGPLDCGAARLTPRLPAWMPAPAS